LGSAHTRSALDSSGPNTLLFAPPLVVGNGFKNEFVTDGCWMLIEAVAQPD
jgi:hypothetical protein